jgi:hypothetical protein
MAQCGMNKLHNFSADNLYPELLDIDSKSDP